MIGLSRSKRSQSSPAPADPELSGTGLSLIAVDGDTLASFPPDIVRNMRLLTTRLAGASELPRRLAVTSAVRQEGATYVSLLLATVLAHDFQQPTCLVELNWLAPRLGRLVEGGSDARDPLISTAGVGNDVPLEQVLRPTGLPTLFLAPGGVLDAPQRAVVARSARLRSRLDTLSEQFAHIVFDVPAVHASPDAVPLACLADAVLLVVRQSVTALPRVTAALDELKHANVQGIVLNQVRLATPRRLIDILPPA
jgi:Mrp family chromosome partitioning ATPase